MTLTFLLPASLRPDGHAVVVLRRGKSIDPLYEVLLEGAVIGKVWKAWFRLGGEGWTHNGVTGQKTRRAAVLSLVKKHLNSTQSNA